MQELIFGIVGGLGIFIYGMHLLSDSLKKLTLNRLKDILAKITSNRFNGVLVGVGVTALIQSSSATSVILIGFLNAGLITLSKAIPVILGANIGTTITAQLIAFKLTAFAPVFSAVGAFIFFFGKKNKVKKTGLAILGFGLLFMGLSMMSGAVKPLAGSEEIRNIFITFGSNPLLGILFGLAITVLLQSSSTTIGIVIALALGGLIDFTVAFYLIVGDNIGTCVTAVIASINGSQSSKRLALGHTMFNIIGAAIAYLSFPLYLHYIPLLTPGDLTRQIANVHSMFNIINTIIFLPFITYYILLIKKLIKGDDYKNKEMVHLDENLLNTPNLALVAVKKELGTMLSIAEEMLGKAKLSLDKFNHKHFEEILVDEDSIDKLEKSIQNYIIKISASELSDKSSKLIPVLIYNSNDAERIGDHCEKIAKIAQKKYEDNIKFSDKAVEDIHEIFKLIDQMLKLTQKSITNESTKYAKEALEVETGIKAIISENRTNHVRRLKAGVCENIAGLLFSDLLNRLERISSYLENINEGVLENA